MGTKKYNRRILIELCILFAVFYLPAYLFQTTVRDPSVFNNLFFNFRLWIIYIPQISLIIYLIYLDSQKKLIDFGIKKLKFKDLPYIGITIVALLSIIALIQLFYLLIPFPNKSQEMFLWEIDNLYIIPFILITSFLTGYSEELFFRSYLYTRMEQLQFNRTHIIITVNLIFALGHMYEGISGGITAFILGMLFSIIFIWKKNINIPAIVHGLYNFTVLLLSFILSKS